MTDKQSGSRGLSTFILIFILVCSGIIVAVCYALYDYSASPSGEGDNDVLFIVKLGQGFNSVTRGLVKVRLVNSPKKFKILGAITGSDKKLKAGEYLLSPKMSPKQIIYILTNGRVHLYPLTIPEGYNIYQVADAVEIAGMGTRESFLQAATNAKLMKDCGLSADYTTFEGYLFPDTYKFPKEVKASEIIRTMNRHFNSVYKSEWIKRGNELGFSVHEIVTLASIIEKETGDAAERPLISSVFHNRLKKRMRLETDPTVIYGIKDFDGNLTKKHLRERTPYNTYRIKGLPPGPIANPGLKSIEAALYPSKSDYLFFVSKKDSTHQFSTNIRDHINSVRKYQLRRKR